MSIKKTRYKKIERDMLNISSRIKQVNKNYQVYFDKLKREYVVFDFIYKTKPYILFVIGKTLNYSVLKKAKLLTNQNIKKVFCEVDNHNKTLQENTNNYLLERYLTQLNSYLEFADRKNLINANFENFNTTKWV